MLNRYTLTGLGLLLLAGLAFVAPDTAMRIISLAASLATVVLLFWLFVWLPFKFVLVLATRIVKEEVRR